MKTLAGLGLGWTLAFALLAFDLGVSDVLFPFAAGASAIGLLPAGLAFRAVRAQPPQSNLDARGDVENKGALVSGALVAAGVLFGALFAAAIMMGCLYLMFSGGH